MAQVVLKDFARRVVQQALLRPGTPGQRFDVGFAITHPADAVGNAGSPHHLDQLAGEDFGRVFVGGPLYLCSEAVRSVDMALRAGARREPEHRRRIDDDAHAVRHHRLVLRITRGAIVAYQPGHGIGHAMWQVHAGVAEGDSGKRGGIHHPVACFGIAGVIHCALQVLTGKFQRRFATDVAPGIGALAHWSQGGCGRRGAPSVGFRRVGLQRVREHVEAAGGDDVPGQGVGGRGIDQRQ